LAPKHTYWTNSSVLTLVKRSIADPIQIITERARALALDAIERGWGGPPYDPFSLCDLLKIRVIPREDIADARTVPSPTGFMVEFNPNRPRARIHYSICHEIAHTLFPDANQRVQHRLTHDKMKGDDWQLEMLCNIAASELAMPIGSFLALTAEEISIDTVISLRKRFEVSAEALVLRLIKLTDQQCIAYCASRLSSGSSERPRYVVDYSLASRTWPDAALASGTQIPSGSAVAECTAIGYTAKRIEDWRSAGKVKVHCLGISPYPNQTFPRVIGLLRPLRQASANTAGITYLKGDATAPRGSGCRLVAQVVNDSAFTWGGGFSLAVRQKWPSAQQAFRTWAYGDRRNLSLGNVHLAPVDDMLSIASMVAQRGYGPSANPRIRYSALQTCLQSLCTIAVDQRATVHMPRVGSGLAGGSWSVVSELIDETLCRRGVSVFVYDLPGAEPKRDPQSMLPFSSEQLSTSILN
jgi:O-acetyl-ADP-ribose deacetylase (regulator of RNase III)